MHYFSTPWKNEKILQFPDEFQGVEKGCIENEWVKLRKHSVPFFVCL